MRCPPQGIRTVLVPLVLLKSGVKTLFSTRQWSDLGDLGEGVYGQALDYRRLFPPQGRAVLWARQFSRQQEEIEAQLLQRVVLPRFGQTGALEGGKIPTGSLADARLDRGATVAFGQPWLRYSSSAHFPARVGSLIA